MDSRLLMNIESLKGVGQKRAALYKKLGIDTVYSLLRFYPRSYIDYTNPIPVSLAPAGETAVIRATVFQKQAPKPVRKGLTIYKLFASDDTGEIIITIYNNRYAYDELKTGEEYFFYGKVTGTILRKEMNSPQFLKAEDDLPMQPVYPLTEGLTSKMVITNQKQALIFLEETAMEFLPSSLLKEHGLCSLAFAIENIHFPKDRESLEIARKRLIFEELLTLQLGMNMLKSKSRAETAVKLHDTNLDVFYASLPFDLTGAQKRVISECAEDMKCDTPMNRLVQGDVGSGKTMVAAASMYLCAKNGYQSAIMAPTEILAAQHYATLSKILTPLGVSCMLLTGSLTSKQKKERAALIETGDIQVVAGTHALVQDSVAFYRLGLVVTDEQHRFGVKQRGKLASKGENPHVMVMSATPIPRTLALIIYGDLDVSVIDEMPKGRQKIETFAIPASKRARALGFIKQHIDGGRQAYIVCPMIEENESDLISVQKYYEELSGGFFKGYNLGLLHGKLKANEKEQIMKDFKENRISLLISTTVVEVGIDVPNAVVMMVDNAERFGLSQMHQLRGRVGRGSEKSYCILVSDNRSQENVIRLKAMCETPDGFEIAERDLKLRGPGDFFGSRQHGLPQLKIANMVEDMDLLKETGAIAKEILKRDSGLSEPENLGLKFLTGMLFEQTKDSAYN